MRYYIGYRQIELEGWTEHLHVYTVAGVGTTPQIQGAQIVRECSEQTYRLYRFQGPEIAYREIGVRGEPLFT